MKLQHLALGLLAFAIVLSPLSPATSLAQGRGNYRAKLISPKPGQVVVPGQVLRIEWTSEFPNVDLTMCETEILLSIDGGKTVYMLVAELRNPKVQSIDWIVPNAPTKEAVLDVRFGCMNIYPETPSLQYNFTIGSAAKK